jgi:type VI secretion system Hcp family effector
MYRKHRERDLHLRERGMLSRMVSPTVHSKCWLHGEKQMTRNTLFAAIGLFALIAAQQVVAESMSCSYESPSVSQAQDGASSFEIEDFSFDVEQTLNIGSQSSGAGAGKVTFNPFTINKKLDVSSPKLLQAAARGEIFKTFTCSFFAGGRSVADAATKAGAYLTITFSDAVISQFAIHTAAQGGTQGRENISFEFSKVEFKYN